MWAFVTIKGGTGLANTNTTTGHIAPQAVNTEVLSFSSGLVDQNRPKKVPSGALAEQMSKSADFNSWGSPVVLRAEVPLVTVEGETMVLLTQ